MNRRVPDHCDNSFQLNRCKGSEYTIQHPSKYGKGHLNALEGYFETHSSIFAQACTSHLLWNLKRNSYEFERVYLNASAKRTYSVGTNPFLNRENKLES